ncbi:MAG TPA: hypothetical protein PKD85_15255, partial [Saprospiraceae bacterium]|nr:hypothetical protein [Saprospiraceae bacterium]
RLNYRFKSRYWWKVLPPVPPITTYDNILCSSDELGAAKIRPTSVPYANSPFCKWRTDQEVFSCCTAAAGSEQWSAPDPTDPGKTILESNCAPSFMPNNGQIGDKSYASLCSQFMTNVCENNWESQGCRQYLQSFVNNADVGKVVQNVVKNYINGQAERTGCGTNQYTTPNSKWRCQEPSGEWRDDSKDPFISHTMRFLCTADDYTKPPGFCDLILNQYCAQFTREDLLNDKVLQNICGCHLTGGTGGRETEGGLTGMGTPTPNNQYPYPGVTTACDPICNFSNTIPYSTQTCSSTICILDKVNINIIDSNVGGDVNINQVCEGGGEGKKSDCYISGVDIDSIRSSTGGVVLNQGCSACFAFCPNDEWGSGGPAGAVKVDCNDPAGTFNCNMCKGGKCAPGKGGENGGGDRTGYVNNIKQWTEDHPYWSLIGGVAFVILFAILVTLLYVHFSS